MYISPISAFTVLSAIQVGSQSFEMVKNLPVMSFLFGNKSRLNQSHSNFYIAFINQLKMIYEIDDDKTLPPFVKYAGDLKSSDIIIENWFNPDLIDENITIANQGKYGQRVLLIETNVINKKLVKTHNLIKDKSSFANLLIGYLYYVTNYELIIMNGDSKEIEHIDKILNLFGFMIDDTKLCENVFSDSRVRNNFADIFSTIKNSVKPKLLKQISRKTIKEKLDNTAQNFQLVSYALLNSLLIITEGNVNYQISLDPQLLANGCLQTGNPSSWFFSEQPHNITDSNPLKDFLTKGYGAINKIAKDIRAYSKLEITLPTMSDIKQYMSKAGYYKLEETFSYYAKKPFDSDTYSCINIHYDESTLDSRAALIYNLSLLTLKLINASYVIENVLDLLSFNNDNWVFSIDESANIEKYFSDLSADIQKNHSFLEEFLDNYKTVKNSRAKVIPSSNELIKYIKLASSILSGGLSPKKDLSGLKQTDYIKDHKLNYVKAETLHIIEEHLFKISYQNHDLNQEVYKKEKQIYKLLGMFLNLELNESLIRQLKKYFNIISNKEFKEKYLSPKEEAITPFYKILFRYCGFECNDIDLAIIGVKNNLHDNFYVNFIMNLQEYFNEAKHSVGKYTPLHRIIETTSQHLDYLQETFFGYYIQNDIVHEQ